MKAVIYTRVSTTEQLDNYSLENQERACREYCERNEIEVAKVFREKGASATTVERPQLKAMLQFLSPNKQKIDQVVVWKVDRFARKIEDHFALRAYLKKRGIVLRSATEPLQEDAYGKMFEGFLSLHAEVENMIKSERAKTGMQSAFRDGRWVFRPPTGYKRAVDDSDRASIAPDPRMGPLVREAFELYATGRYKKTQVLRRVSRKGLRTADGARVTPQTFQRMLRNRIYTGWMSVKGWGEPVRGKFEPLVERSLFERVQRVLSGKALPLRQHLRNHPDFPLRHVLGCASCKRPITGSWSKGRNTHYAYYHCPRTACKDRVRVRKENLEERFEVFLEALCPEPALMNLFRGVMLDVWQQANEEVSRRAEALAGKAQELQTKREKLIDAFVYREAIDRGTYEEQKERIERELACTEIELADAKAIELDVEPVLDFAQHLLLFAPHIWREASFENKLRFQAAFFPGGLKLEDGKFRTAATSPVFSILEATAVRKSRMASPTGFEPVSPP